MSAVERVWADARGEIDAAALERDDCLDDVAAAYAATAADVGGSGEEPTVPEVSCGGGVKLGYALGFDESGVGQATAALTMTADGPSPIVSTSAREVGYALVPARGATGEVNGYVLAWAVSK